MKHILRDATSVACAPKPGKTSIMPACRHCCRRCCHRLLFFKIKVRPQSCRSYPIWLPWNCLFFRPLKFLSMFQVICQILGGDPGWLLLQCRLQKKKKCWGLPKLHISLHSDHHSVLWWSKRQWWVTFPPFFSHPSVHPLHKGNSNQISFHIFKFYTCWRWNTDTRILNIWISIMGK